MRRLAAAFILVALFWLPGESQAQTMVYETSKGSATVYNVSLATTATSATRVDLPPSRWTKNRFEIEVYNDDSVESLRCAFTVDVSTVSSDANYGREVRPKTGVAWKVPDSVPVYCKVEGSGSGTLIAAIAIVTQL